MRNVARTLLHPRAPGERPWKYLLPVLALAFVARAAIALSGDFVLHPDEIMQYLEPAHRLVFGGAGRAGDGDPDALCAGGADPARPVLSSQRQEAHGRPCRGGAVAAVGVFDAVTWNGGLFHSYVVNIAYNLVAGGLRAGESPPWQFLWWLALAGAGLNLLVIALALRDPRRYGLLLGLIVVMVLIHSAQAHKEYRFIFAVIPLWLLIGADLATRLTARLDARRQARSSPKAAPRHSFAKSVPAGVMAAVFAAVSVAGILNALPYQYHVYRGYSRETGIVRFIRNQDPIFAAYRYLARAPGVAAVWQTDRAYFNLPGYYYLHHAIPLYAGDTAPLIFADQEASEGESIARAVSHIVSADPALAIPGYAVEREFGGIRILRRQADAPAIRLWQDYTPTISGVEWIMSRVDPDAPVPPPNSGVRFIDENAPASRR